MPAYSTELPVDHHFCKRNPNSCHHILQTDFQLWLLDKSDCHPEGNPNISKQIDFIKHNPLLQSLSEALNDYEDFLEPQLNPYELHILGKLLDSLFWRYNTHNGRYSSWLSWSSHRQIFWHRSRSGHWVFYPYNRTKNQLCSWRRTCRCWWTDKLHFQEESTVFFFTPRSNPWVVREQYYQRNNQGEGSNKFHH